MTAILTTGFLPELEQPVAVLDRLRPRHRELLRAASEATAAGRALAQRYAIEDGKVREGHARAARTGGQFDEPSVAVTPALRREAEIDVVREREVAALEVLAEWIPSAVRELEASREELERVAQGAGSGNARLYPDAHLAANVLRGLDSFRFEDEAAEVLAQAKQLARAGRRVAA